MFLTRARNQLYALPAAADHIPDRNIDRLRIGFDSASVSITFFQALREFGADHPSLELGLIEADPGTLVDMLRSGVLDLALTTATVPAVQSDITSFSLPRRQLNVLLPSDHLLARAMQVDLALMNNDPLVVYEDDSNHGNRELALRACQRAGFKPPTVIETNSYASMAGMVVAGRGYTVCPDDPSLNTLRSTMSMIPLLQSWDSQGTISLYLRSSNSTYRDEFLRCFASKHRSR